MRSGCAQEGLTRVRKGGAVASLRRADKRQAAEVGAGRRARGRGAVEGEGRWRGGGCWRVGWGARHAQESI